MGYIAESTNAQAIMQSLTAAFERENEVNDLGISRNLGTTPSQSLYHTGGTTRSSADAGAKSVVDRIAAPTIQSLNNVMMVPTQMVSYVVDEGMSKRLAWDSFPFEALDRRCVLGAAGDFGYASEFREQHEYDLPTRVTYRPDVAFGGLTDRAFQTVRDAPVAARKMLTPRPCAGRADPRDFIAEAAVLQGVLEGGSITQQQIKTFNHVLSGHRYFGAQGSVFKEAWKVAESDRLNRMAMMARLVGNGQLYIRMMFKLISMYYSAMAREEASGPATTSGSAHHASWPAAAVPTVRWLDAYPPSFSEEVTIYSVANNVAQQGTEVAHDLFRGFYVHRQAPNLLVRYATRAALDADWGTWATPAATVAAAERASSLMDLERHSKSKRFGVSQCEPKEFATHAVGGEDLFFEDFMQVHERRMFLLDAEGVPTEVLEVWLNALAAKSHVNYVARRAGTDTEQRFIPHSESVMWAVDYSRVYVHTGSMHAAEVKNTVDTVDYATRARDSHSTPSTVILDAIRWLLLKTAAEEDFFHALDLADSMAVATRTRRIRGTAAGLDMAFHAMFQGYEVKLPLDITLPAYFSPFRAQGFVSSEVEEWLALRVNMKQNLCYYKHIMQQNAFSWAAFASSASAECWTPSTGAPSARERACIQHGRELTVRRDSYALSLFDRLIVSACAHMYNWAPSRHYMVSHASARVTATSFTGVGTVEFGTLWRPHTVPHGVHVYAELWLAKKVPDFMMLPVPEGTIKWPEDKGRPIVDSAADAGQVRLGATMQAFDYKYWLADGGQVFSAQYYVAANASAGVVNRAATYKGGAAEATRLAYWRKPVQSAFPAGATNLPLDARGGMRLDGDFSNYLDPFMMEVYSHHHKLPLAWGVEHVDTTGIAPVAVPGAIRSWFRINQGAVSVAPTLTFEAPTWAVRDVEPIADYFMAALVDPLEGKFAGFHWASVTTLKPKDGTSREGASPIVTLTNMPSIRHSSALANDNEPHMPRGRGGSARRTATGGPRGRKPHATPAGKSFNKILAAAAPSELEQADQAAPDDEEVVSPTGIAAEVKGRLDHTPRVELLEEAPVLIQPDAEQFTTVDGRVIKRARIVAQGGNASRRRAVAAQAKRAGRGTIIAGAGVAGGATANLERASTSRNAVIADAVASAVMHPSTAAETYRALLSSLGSGASVAADSFADKLQSFRRPIHGLTTTRARSAAKVMNAAYADGALDINDVALIVKAAPEIGTHLPDGMRTQIPAARTLEFGTVTCELASPRGVEDLPTDPVELTDAAAYEAQANLQAEAAHWSAPPITPGAGQSPKDAALESGGARLPILDWADESEALN
ncbi:hypothetical protein [Phytophthora fragariae fusagravirus 1]|nr:hypothetical protein [Phytophthora fragariae fusagravirus 1]